MAKATQQPSPATTPSPPARRTRGRSSTSDAAEGDSNNGDDSDGNSTGRRRRGKKPTKKRKLDKQTKPKRKPRTDEDDGRNDDDDDDGSVVADLCEVCNINENDELSLICDACDKEQNQVLQRENQKLMEYIDRQNRRMDELLPLEEALRSMQYKYRKLEGQLVEAQAQLSSTAASHASAGSFSSHSVLPKYTPQPSPYLPRPDEGPPDYRPTSSSSGHYDMRGSSHHHPLRRSTDFPHQPFRHTESDYAARAHHADEPPAVRGHHLQSQHLHHHSRYVKGSRQNDVSYYRDAKPPASRDFSTPQYHHPSSLPYSQPPIYQKSNLGSTSKHAQSSYASSSHHAQYPPPSTAHLRGSDMDNYSSHSQLPPPSSYYRPHSHHPPSAAPSNQADSFLPRPPLPDRSSAPTSSHAAADLPKVAIPVYSSDEDDRPHHRHHDHDDDAANVLNSMKRTEASSERLNLLTPTANDAANAAASTLAILKPTNTTEEAPSAHRIGLYTPRSRRLMLDRYLLKRSKRLSRHKWFKYPVRKTLADTRPRVKGRFVKHDLVEDEEGDLSSSPKKTPSESPHRTKSEDFETNKSDFDYIQAFALCVKETKDAVDKVVLDILRNKQRKGELVSWDSLEGSLTSLLPKEYVASPFPAIFGELVYILGDAEEDCNQENFCRALQAGAIYVAVCLSFFTATHSPKSYESRISPILSHYSQTTKKLWQEEPHVQKKHTFAMMKSIVDGIAGVIAVGYHDGKQYLKPVSVAELLVDETASEGSASSH
ncbi:hypothetical protein DYB32_001379 [Aphanomyces invadans]|uniref:CCT domain-containing protein n=1 Tax=Aphanomyces invadans TaxID=157072 RepID=A0A3R6WSB6_9STRA|nr:hypothetical protein DYB32_001379 [Aphanomyces invadans]